MEVLNESFSAAWRLARVLKRLRPGFGVAARGLFGQPQALFLGLPLQASDARIRAAATQSREDSAAVRKIWSLIDQLRSEPDRIVDVSWAPTQSSVFLVEIMVEALDRKSLLSDVTRVLAEHHVNILSASVNTSRSRVAISKFVFEMGDPKHLGHVIAAVRRVDGVFDAYRVTSGGVLV